MNAFVTLDIVSQVRNNPYYKCNHLGRIACTLCNVSCLDDNNFFKHLSGKRHQTQLAVIDRRERRRQLILEEEQINKEVEERCQKEKAMRELSAKTNSGSSKGASLNADFSNNSKVFSPFGNSTFRYTTEHDPSLFQTKVWLEFLFVQAQEGARPLHRWRSAREVHLSGTTDNSVVYLLVACEGYSTIGLEFPAQLNRSTPEDGEAAYMCTWDPIKKLRPAFFRLKKFRFRMPDDFKGSNILTEPETELKIRLDKITQCLGQLSRGGEGREDDINVREASKVIAQFGKVFCDCVEKYGIHPQRLLGQHICCNVLILVLDRIVKPSLNQYSAYIARRKSTRLARSANSTPHSSRLRVATLPEVSREEQDILKKGKIIREDILQPFRSLLESLHCGLSLEELNSSETCSFISPPTHRATSSGSFAQRNELGSRSDSDNSLFFPDFFQSTDQCSSLGDTKDDEQWRLTENCLYDLPLLWKHGVPLFCICNHSLEVLQSATLSNICGVEYIRLLDRLFKWKGYTSNLNPTFIAQLIEFLMTAAESTVFEIDEPKNLNSLGLEDGCVYVNLLSDLLKLPQAVNAFKSFSKSYSMRKSSTTPDAIGDKKRREEEEKAETEHVSHTVARLQELLLARHQNPSKSLRFEMHLVRALRYLVFCIQHEFPEVAMDPIVCVKCLCDLFSRSLNTRADAWKIEVLSFLSQQLCVHFSKFLGEKVASDLRSLRSYYGYNGHTAPSLLVPLSQCARRESVSHPESNAKIHVSTLALLHETVYPLFRILFGMQRNTFSFLSRRDLFLNPCYPLSDVFDFGSIVVYLCHATHDHYSSLYQVTEAQSDARSDLEEGRVNPISTALLSPVNSNSISTSIADHKNIPNRVLPDKKSVEGDRLRIYPKQGTYDELDDINAINGEFRFAKRRKIERMSVVEELVDAIRRGLLSGAPTALSSVESLESDNRNAISPKVSPAEVDEKNDINPPFYKGIATDIGAPLPLDSIKDSTLFFLHLLTRPCTVLGFSSSECDSLVEVLASTLLPLPHLNRMGSLLLAAISAIVPFCSFSAQERLRTFIMKRFLLSDEHLSGIDYNTKINLHCVLSTLTENTLLLKWSNFNWHEFQPIVGARESMPLPRSLADSLPFSISLSRFFTCYVENVRAAVQVLEPDLDPQAHNVASSHRAPCGTILPVEHAADCILPPALFEQMIRLLTLYEVRSFLSLCTLADSFPSIRKEAFQRSDCSQSKNGDYAGFTFVLNGIVHSCLFFHIFSPQKKNGKDGPKDFFVSNSYHDSDIEKEIKGDGFFSEIGKWKRLVKEERHGFLNVLATVEEYSMALCALHALEEQDPSRSAANCDGAYTFWGGQVHRSVSKWRLLASQRCTSPQYYIPSVALRASELHWLLLSNISPATFLHTFSSQTFCQDSEKSSEVHLRYEEESKIPIQPDMLPCRSLDVISLCVAEAFCLLVRRLAYSSGSEEQVQWDQKTSSRLDAGLSENFYEILSVSFPNKHPDYYKQNRKIVLDVQCVQMLHLLLRLNQTGLWALPPISQAMTPEGSSSFSTHTLEERHERAGINNTGTCYDDRHQKFSAMEIERFMLTLNPQEKIYYACLWLSDYLSGRMKQYSPFQNEPLFRAFLVFYSDVGRTLLSEKFQRDSEQSPFIKMTKELYGCLSDVLMNLKNPTADKMIPTSIEITVQCTLLLATDIIRVLLLLLPLNNLVKSSLSVPPVIDPVELSKNLYSLLRSHHFLPDFPSISAYPYGPYNLRVILSRFSNSSVDDPDGIFRPRPHSNSILSVIEGIHHLMLVLRFAYQDKLSTAGTYILMAVMFTRYRFGAAHAILRMISRSARYSLPHNGSCLPSDPLPDVMNLFPDNSTELANTDPLNSLPNLSDDGLMLSVMVETLTSDEIPDMPYITPTLQYWMLMAAFSILHQCSTDESVKLKELSFLFLTRKAPYCVRREAASHIGILFRAFPSEGKRLLPEFLSSARDGILSSNLTMCSTTLLALAEVACAAPQLENQIVYTLLECLASRGFIFSFLLLDCLQRIAERTTFLSSDSNYLGRVYGKDYVSFRELCNFHRRFFIYQWFWCYEHPLEAIPVECFGEKDTSEMVYNSIESILPIALMLGAKSTFIESSSQICDEGFIIHPLLLFLESVYQKRHNFNKREEGIDRDATDGILRMLLTFFPQTIAQLVLFSQVYLGGAGTCYSSGSTPHLADYPIENEEAKVLSRSAESALRFVQNLLSTKGASLASLGYQVELDTKRNEFFPLFPPHTDSSSTIGGRNSIFEFLIICHTDKLFAATTDFLGDDLPFFNTKTMTLAAERLVEFTEFRTTTTTTTTTNNNNNNMENNNNNNNNSNNALFATEVLATPNFFGSGTGILRPLTGRYFIRDHGDRAYFLLQHLFEKVSRKTSSPFPSIWRRKQYLIAYGLCIKVWFGAEVLCLPHVAHLILSQLHHLLIQQTREYKFFCSLLTLLWPHMVHTKSKSLSQQNVLIQPFIGALTTTIMAMAKYFPIVRSTWLTLCQCDPTLQEKDWQLLCREFVVASSHSQLLEAEKIADVGEIATITNTTTNSGENRSQAEQTNSDETVALESILEHKAHVLLRLLENVSRVDEWSAATHFELLADAVDEERSTFSNFIQAEVHEHSLKQDSFSLHSATSSLGKVTSSLLSAISDLYSMCMTTDSWLQRPETVSNYGMRQSHFLPIAPTVSEGKKASVLNLLRALCWCFINAERTFLLSRLFSSTPTVSASMFSRMENILFNADSIDHIIGYGFSELLKSLLNISYASPTGFLAKKASSTLRSWMALPFCSPETAETAESDQKNIISIESYIMRIAYSFFRPTRIEDSDLSSSITEGGDAILNRLICFCRSTPTLLSESAEKSLPTADYSSEAYDSHWRSLHLLDARLWDTLQFPTDAKFTLLFSVAAIHSYELHKKIVFFRLLLPLLYELLESTEACKFDPSIWHFAGHLLPLVMCHLLLTPEDGTLRASRSKWSSLLDVNLFQRAELFPSCARLFLSTINLLRIIFAWSVSRYGLHPLEPPSTKAFNKPNRSFTQNSTQSRLGRIPLLTDMRECYWLSDIPLQNLSNAYLAIQEPHLATVFIELSGESLLRPSSGIFPASSYSYSESRSSSSLFPSLKKDSVRGGVTRISRSQYNEREISKRLSKFRSTLYHLLLRVNEFTNENSSDEELQCTFDWNTPEQLGMLDSMDSAISFLKREKMAGRWRQVLTILSILDSGSLFSEDPSRCRQFKFILAAEKANALLQMGDEEASIAVTKAALESISMEDTEGDSLRGVLAEALWRSTEWYRPSNEVSSCLGAVGSEYADKSSPLRALRSSFGRGSMTLSQKVSVHESLLYSLLSAKLKEPDSVRRHTNIGFLTLHKDFCGANWFSTVAVAEALYTVKRCFGSSHDYTPSPSKVVLPGLYTSFSTPVHSLNSSLAHRSELRVLDSLRLCVCQMLGDLDTWRKYLITCSERALLAGVPHISLQWLRVFEKQLQQRDASQPPLPINKDEENDMISLTLLCARSEYELGFKLNAVARLRNVHQGDVKSSPNEEDSLEFRTFSYRSPHNGHKNPKILLQLLNWCRELNLEPLSTLVRDPYLALCSSSDTTGRCSYQLARLCHSLLKDIATRMKSPTYSQLQEGVQSLKHIREDILRKQEEKALNTAERHLLAHRLKSVAVEVSFVEDELVQELSMYGLYRRSALNSYARYLQYTKEGDDDELLAVFGFVELWLKDEGTVFDDSLVRKGDKDGSGANSTKEVLQKALTKTPSGKFLRLFSQLAAQLGSSSDDSRLSQLVKRIAKDYPLQTLWTIQALANGQRFSSNTSSSSRVYAVDSVKVTSANRILHELEESTENLAPGVDTQRDRPSRKLPLSEFIRQISILSNAYIECAFYKVTDKGKESHPIPKTFQILQMVENISIPPPTLTLTNYGAESAIPTIIRYEKDFRTPGGVNVPKVLHCLLSDGTVIQQLLKSHDDLRQDSLIEQIFQLSNSLFIKERHTRFLSIYSYNVIPLAPTVGIVEWVHNTMPLGQYLTGSCRTQPFGAHERYFPYELSSRECRERLEKTPKTEKKAQLLSLYECFTPALHYFFYDYFYNASEWLERRKSYSRSLAASNMVGFIVGLGDRHCNNLLLHKKTAEIVHIDLGIAFDQNRTLPIPELVPFRLTRNMVDGLGVQGTEGPFKIQCHTAMTALRARRELLLTILEAFIHDPLARWSVTITDEEEAHEKMEFVDGTTTEASNSQRRRGKFRRLKTSHGDAQRTLASVTEKLTGYTSGEFLSVPNQVEKLNRAAQDVEKLAVIYSGWSPWL